MNFEFTSSDISKLKFEHKYWIHFPLEHEEKLVKLFILHALPPTALKTIETFPILRLIRIQYQRH